MPAADARGQLAERQAQLLRALSGETPPPPGFDAERVEAAATSLIRKRQREVARAWPALVKSLGSEAYGSRFVAFARKTPPPECGGPLADGYAFARSLLALGKLPDEGRVELLAVDLRWKRVRGGLVPRRGWTIRLARLTRSRHLVLGVRLPWLGVRWWVW